jgi:MFS family permease
VSRVDASFRGWSVVVAAFAGQMIFSSGTFALFGLLVIPLTETFDVSRGAVSVGLALGMLMMGFMGPLIGRMLDAGHTRRMMLCGAVLMPVGLLAVSRATEFWQVLVCFPLIVFVGGSLFGPIPTLTLVSNWFIRRRGFALGITAAGATTASFITPPLFAWLMERYDWRTAVASIAIGGFAIVTPILWAYVIARPEDVGQLPDGEVVSETETPSDSAFVSPKTRELMRDPNLWIQGLAFAFLFASPVVLNLHLVPFAVDLGISFLRASYLLAVSSVFSLIGKLVFSRFADRVDPRRAVWAITGGLVLPFLLLLSGPSYTLLLITAGVFGLAVGAVIPVHGLIVGACFGRGGFGRVMGIGGLMGLPIIASAGVLAGVIYDRTGSYTMSFQLQIALLVLSGSIMLFLRIPEFEPGTEPGRLNSEAGGS